MSLASNAPHEPAYRTSGTDVKPDQFAAKLRHVGMNTRAPGQSRRASYSRCPSQNGILFGRGDIHSTPFAPHSVIVITKRDRHEAEWFHNRAAGNARA